MGANGFEILEDESIHFKNSTRQSTENAAICGRSADTFNNTTE